MIDKFEYFLTIWEPTGERDGFRPVLERKEVKRFWNALDAWKYVIDEKVLAYTLHKAECIIDETFADRWIGKEIPKGERPP